MGHDPEVTHEITDLHHQASADTETESSIVSVPPPSTGLRFHIARARASLGRFLNSRKVQLLILGLIILDLLIVLTEILLSLFAEPVCRPAAPGRKAHPVHNPTIVKVENILSIISLSILSSFALELLLRLFAFGIKHFTHHLLHLWDAVVIITSLVLTARLHGRAEEAAGLLIVLRIWRIVRVMESVAMGMKDTIGELEKEVKKLKRELGKTKDRNHELEERCRELEEGKFQ
ncbi:uncharacterized protein VTP21DRAFT_11597 [Calcarisporiella thermophila]|uniref:uncharacterized protein n=1 Tax=Calcarisporiella thermophila TaxID=911321 RepID=UPI0037441EB4